MSKKYPGWKVAAAILLSEDKNVHYKVLTRLVLETNLSNLSPDAATPEETLGREMREHPSSFVWPKKDGFYGLTNAGKSNNEILNIKKILREQKSNLNLESDIKGIISGKQVNETDKIRLVLSRIGQGEFRQELIKYWAGCSVTGCKQIKILRASHIKPWSKCNNEERLDFFNGFLLIPNLDSAFDQGFVTFDENGKIIISSLLESDLDVLGIHIDMRVKLAEQHKGYLRFHRENIFNRF